MKPTKILDYPSVVGVGSSLFYSTVKMEDISLATYDYFIAIGTGNWIAKNEDQYIYHGLSDVVNHPFPLIGRVVEMLIDTYINRVEVECIRSYIKGISGIVDSELMITVKVNLFNMSKYRSLLTAKEIEMIDTSQVEFVDIKCIRVIGGLIRVSDRKIEDIDYESYTTQLYTILKKIPNF